MTPAANDGRRLNSWKEVAAYFGRTDRTVMRWEAERGLPIHRVPGMPKSRIYAEVVELEAWRRGAQSILDEEDASEPGLGDPVTRTTPKPRLFIGRRIWFAAGLVALAILVALIFQLWRRGASVPFMPPPPPPIAAERLYVAGMEDWERRTPESLNRAVDEFRQAITVYPRYAEAYAGLADCYDLLREYTLMPETQSYVLAKAAAEHALALNDRLPGAHAALAFADFYGFWDTAGALAHFQRAVALDPNDATSRHWYATFLMSLDNKAEALRQIEAARSIDPNSLSIQADEGLILIVDGQDARGVAQLQQLAREHPDFLSPHAYLADRALMVGDDQQFLREASIAANITSNTARLTEIAAARRGLESGGHLGLLRALYAAQTRQFEAGVGNARDLAFLAVLMGDKKQALADLSLAVDRHEASMAGISATGPFKVFAGDPAFERIVARLKSAGG